MSEHCKVGTDGTKRRQADLPQSSRAGGRHHEREGDDGGPVRLRAGGGGWAAGGSVAQVLLCTSVHSMHLSLSLCSPFSPGAQCSGATDTCSLSKPCLCPRATKWKSLGMKHQDF